MKQKYLADELKVVLGECEKIVSDWKHSNAADVRLQRLYRMQVNHSMQGLIKVIEKMCIFYIGDKTAKEDNPMNFKDQQEDTQTM